MLISLGEIHHKSDWMFHLSQRFPIGPKGWWKENVTQVLHKLYAHKYVSDFLIFIPTEKNLEQQEMTSEGNVQE